MTLRQFVGCIAAATLGLVLAVSPASAQSAEAALKLGDIEGSSTIQGKQGTIEVLSYSWGVANGGTVAVRGGGSEAGKANFSEFNFMISADKAVPQLFIKTALGEVIPEATFTVFTNPMGKPQDLIKIKFQNVILTSFQVSGSSELPTYSVAMSFTQIELQVWEQRSNGTYAPLPPVMWDIKTSR